MKCYFGVRMFSDILLYIGVNSIADNFDCSTVYLLSSKMIGRRGTVGVDLEDLNVKYQRDPSFWSSLDNAWF